MKKPYDPKLRKAAIEFSELCEKYDCMGVVLLVSPTHSEFVNHFNPSWSVMHLEPPNGLRFRSKKEDFNSKEEQHEKTEATAHGVTSIVEWSRKTNEVWTNILSQLSTQMTIIHSVWGKPDSVPGDGK